METIPWAQSPATPGPCELAVGDGQLLERFIRERDESAFAELVRRHGPMVLGVCRRVLDNPHDAEDCFQAAFMVLVRKAESVRPSSMVGNWLYGVAYRTALEARKLAARRRIIEKKKVAESPGTAVPGPWASLRPELDRELSRLPDKYRAILVACDLEGKTRREVAAALDLPDGTVASRLARARRMLAKRMSRYQAISAGALACLLTEKAAEPVPPRLLEATVKAAEELAAAPAFEGTLSPIVARLCDAVIKSMLWTKIQVGAASLAALAMIAFALIAIIPAVQAERKAGAAGLVKSDKVKPRQYLRDCIVAKVDAEKQKLELRQTAGPAPGPAVTYDLAVAPGAEIIIDGHESRLTDLREGCAVQVEMDADAGGSCQARRIEALGEELRGVVLAVDAGAVTLAAGQDADKRICRLDADSRVTIDGKQATWSDLKAKMKVAVRMSAQGPVALEVCAAGSKVAGTVKAVNAGKQTLEVSIDDAQMVAEAAVSADAEVTIATGKAKLSDVKAGMRVIVQMSAVTEPSFIVAITERPRK